MNTRNIFMQFIVTSCLTLGLCHTAAADNGSQPTIYVAPLKAVLAADGSSENAGNSRRTQKVEKNASALTAALIRELSARGVTAYPLSEQVPAPHTGWVVRGLLTQRVPKGLVFSGLRSLGSSTPNTEVDISVCDLGGASNKPARLINTAASLGGQGSAISLNPYEAAAKVVLHRVSADRSIDDLARRVADQILARESLS